MPPMLVGQMLRNPFQKDNFLNTPLSLLFCLEVNKKFRYYGHLVFLD